MPKESGLTLPRILESAFVLVAIALAAFPSLAGTSPKSRPPAGGEFFIVSSVDAKKHQLVLKHPTEVTELVLVNEKTLYRDEQGGALKFQNLRAGDTVYVTLSRGPDGTHIATQIRKGPMTVEELHRRYVPFQ